MQVPFILAADGTIDFGLPSTHFALMLLVGSIASVAVFELCVLLYKKVKTPLLNPLLVTLVGLILVLTLFNIPLDTYEESVSIFSFLLGPATVALAYSVYKQRQILKEHFIPIFAGCLVGSVVSMVSAYTLCKVLGLGSEMALSFIPKSVTTPHRHRRLAGTRRNHVDHGCRRHHHGHPRRHLLAPHGEDLPCEEPHRDWRRHRRVLACRRHDQGHRDGRARRRDVRSRPCRIRHPHDDHRHRCALRVPVLAAHKMARYPLPLVP